MPKIIIAGNSHTQAAKAAWPRRPTTHSFDIVWIKGKEGSKAALYGDIFFNELIERVQQDAHALIALWLAGTKFNHLGLAKHDQPFHVLVDGEEGEGELISRGLVRDYYQAAIGAIEHRFLKLKKATEAPVYHLATPPPKGDQALLQALFRAHKREINRPSQRLALWHIEMEVLKAACAEWGIGFVDPPTGTQDGQGFLKRDFYARDITHANADYGELVLRQLEELATTQRS